MLAEAKGYMIAWADQGNEQAISIVDIYNKMKTDENEFMAAKYIIAQYTELSKDSKNGPKS